MTESPNSAARAPAGRSVTVIMCTFNRAATLGHTLDGLAASEMPTDATWEVLIVDNNSTDQTREVVQEFCRRHPQTFRYVFEPRSGKSHAANTGVKAARGEVLAFVDDDVTVDPQWLSRISAPLFDGKWAGVGGRTLAADSFTAPAWYRDEDDGALLYGRFDFGDQPCELIDAPFGANMAFRKDTFEKYGGFRTDLGPGPDPDVPRPNEDTEYGRRLMAAGEHLLYEPRAVLRHPVNIHKLNQKFYLAWSFDYGRASALEIKKRSVLGIRREYFSLAKHLLLLPAETLIWLFSVRPRTRFRHKRAVWRISGRIVETYRRTFGRKQPNPSALDKTKSDLAADRRAQI